MPSTAPLQFLLLMFAGWVNRRQQDVIAYLMEENPATSQDIQELRGCTCDTMETAALSELLGAERAR